MHDDILIHHGVKGMKWGVRRYRNKDGSLTAEGKARAKKRADKAETHDKKEEYKQASKNRRNLSDEELSKRIKRLENEKKLKKLTEDNTRSTGGKMVREILNDSGKKVVKAAVAGGVALLGKAIIEGSFSGGAFNPNLAKIDPSEMARYLFPNPNKKK